MTLAQILTRAREQIRSGRLPLSLPSKMWADHGKGQRCAVCDQVIASVERQYEFALPTPSGHSDHCIHFACYQAWIACRSIAGSRHTELV
jgi:hypothetical protein